MILECRLVKIAADWYGSIARVGDVPFGVDVGFYEDICQAPCDAGVMSRGSWRHSQFVDRCYSAVAS